MPIASRKIKSQPAGTKKAAAKPSAKRTPRSHHYRVYVVERLHGIRLQTRRQAKDEVIDWPVWYNSRRLHLTLGYMSLTQYEQHWCAGQPKTVNL